MDTKYLDHYLDWHLTIETFEVHLNSLVDFIRRLS